jgi:hypothetical protein
VFDEEDGDAIVGSPRGKQQISLVKCRVHYNPSKNDQAEAERLTGRGDYLQRSNQRIKLRERRSALRSSNLFGCFVVISGWSNYNPSLSIFAVS